MMKITWLGQAGFLFKNDGLTILIDPYLSNSCYKVNPRLNRRYPVDESFFKIDPDIIILTHSHLDHTDPETLDFYLKEKSGVTVLASENSWNKVKSYGPGHNYVLFNEGTEYTIKNITFKAVHAEHSDNRAIGVTFDDGTYTYYVTGDTLYNRKVFESLSEQIDVIFLPINGAGNNMNMVDAHRFVDKVGAKKAVACHFGLFDDMDIVLEKEMQRKGFIIPKPFKEISL